MAKCTIWFQSEMQPMPMIRIRRTAVSKVWRGKNKFLMHSFDLVKRVWTGSRQDSLHLQSSCQQHCALPWGLCKVESPETRLTLPMLNDSMDHWSLKLPLSIKIYQFKPIAKQKQGSLVDLLRSNRRLLSVDKSNLTFPIWSLYFQSHSVFF